MVKATEYMVEIFNRETDEYESDDSDCRTLGRDTYFWFKQHCFVGEEIMDDVNCRFGYDFMSEDLADWEDLNIEDIFRISDSLETFSLSCFTEQLELFNSI